MTEQKKLTLMPPAHDKCQQCAVKHAPSNAHNADSLFYKYWFYGQHGRWPTWADAISHLDTDMQEFWKNELTARGAWNGN